MRFVVAVLMAAPLLAASNDAIVSLKAGKEANLTANPDTAFWRAAKPAIAENNALGKATPGHRTEIRSRWTADNLYFLFTCPYEELHLKPGPVTNAETDNLWDWDVAEVFIGSDPANIRRYKEFEVSPQGEWVDLDIDLDKPPIQQGWVWNSGFASRARLDRERKVWYAEMRIPFAALDAGAPAAGRTFRVNFYRIQGAPPNRRSIAWRPTNARTYHVPESFGELRLATAE